MELSMAHDTDASTNTSTSTESHIMPLNNHLNKGNRMASLMAPSVSCDRNHVTAMYMPKTNMVFKCYIYTTCAN